MAFSPGRVHRQEIMWDGMCKCCHRTESLNIEHRDDVIRRFTEEGWVLVDNAWYCCLCAGEIKNKEHPGHIVERNPIFWDVLCAACRKKIVIDMAVLDEKGYKFCQSSVEEYLLHELDWVYWECLWYCSNCLKDRKRVENES